MKSELELTRGPGMGKIQLLIFLGPLFDLSKD